jgi:hypothetical protein
MKHFYTKKIEFYIWRRVAEGASKFNFSAASRGAEIGIQATGSGFLPRLTASARMFLVPLSASRHKHCLFDTAGMQEQ